MALNILINIFEQANGRFLTDDKNHILSGVAERCLCGSLQKLIWEELITTKYRHYHVDVEYNRNQGKVKTIIDDNCEVMTVNCDLIIHSRGEVIAQDNLLALEMKKSERPLAEKNKDRKRLIALTKLSYDDIWSNDGEAFPEHVCGYLLGVYYEINIRNKTAQIEYYCVGRLYRKYKLKF